MQNIYINVKNLNITDPQVTNFIEQLGEGISSTASTAQSMATTLKINVKDRINVSENVVTVLKPEDKEENK
jgi:hypothetical protein